MKAIYDAIRDVLYPNDAEFKARKRPPVLKPVPELPDDLRGTLRYFESCNRGHQTLLSAIPQTRNGIIIQTSAERTARATLMSSTRTLLRSVTSANGSPPWHSGSDSRCSG